MEYHLKTVSKTCAHGGEPLEPNTVCVSVVVERDGELVRLDYCEDDWPGPPEGVIGQWRCRVPEAEPVGHASIDPDALMRFFENLTEKMLAAETKGLDASMVKLRYVTALLLMQKRRLKLDGTRRDGDREILEFQGARGEGTFDVPDCQLQDSEMEGLQNQLHEHMHREGL
tara:strand:+ start:1733 stop:2245 length:513 start_codon:yes stop_codon:yes gene_type:complete